MGAPLSDAPRLHHWSNWIQRQFSADLADKRDVIEQAVVEFYDYVGALLERRRDDPSDDLISKLLAAEFEGDRLSEVELVNLVLNVLIGGVDTSQSQLTHAVRLLAEHPDQWELLARDASLAPRAADEALRFEPIVPFTAPLVGAHADGAVALTDFHVEAELAAVDDLVELRAGRALGALDRAGDVLHAHLETDRRLAVGQLWVDEHRRGALHHRDHPGRREDR